MNCSQNCGAVILREEVLILDLQSISLVLQPIQFYFVMLVTLVLVLLIWCIFFFRIKVQREKVEFHLESASKLHLDLACVKMNKNNEEFQEVTKRLEATIDALEKQVEDMQVEFSTKVNERFECQVLKLKEESLPFVLSGKLVDLTGCLSQQRKE